MANKKIPTLSYETPLIKEHLIIETVFTDKYPNKSIIKYVNREKVGEEWKEIVKTYFIDNPDHVDYTGCKIKITTEISG